MPRGYSDVPRFRRGSPPRDGTLIGSHTLTGWDLYARHVVAKGEARWVNLKLVSPGDRPRKANYWLAYDAAGRDFNTARDVRLLEREEPGLLTWIAETVLKWDRERPAPSSIDELLE